MYTIPNPYYRHSNWLRAGAEFAGIIFAGRCILAMAFFGFGLLLMGTVMTVVSKCVVPSNLKGEIAQQQLTERSNPVRVLGPVFLGVGSVLFLLSTFLLVAACKSARRSIVGITNTPEMVTISADSYPPPYYPPPEEPYGPFPQIFPFSSKQPYSATSMVGQTYPSDPLEPAYPPSNPGCGFGIPMMSK